LNATPDPRWAPHATVATVVVDGGRVLLVEETIDGRQVLNQPAGHLEPGESLAEAALRETREETGWTVQLTHFIGCYQWTAGDGTPSCASATRRARSRTTRRSRWTPASTARCG
jgi:8-oxo-dGTP pyrophosphatase MutT (NUDIX family)